MKEKRMNALWQPNIWSGLLRAQVVPHYPIPNGTVVWFKFSQGRYLVQTALKQGRAYIWRRTWCAHCGRYNGRLDRAGYCQSCAAWWRANPGTA